MSTATLLPKAAQVSSPDDPYASTSVLAVANLFIEIGLEEMRPEAYAMTHMRLQKLCYRAYWHHLHAYGAPLCDERPEIWPRGPGFMHLYLALQHAGRKPVRDPITTPYGTPTVAPARREADFLRRVADHYRRTTTLDLAGLAHARGGAWQPAAESHHYRCPMGSLVPDALIRAEFAASGVRP